MKKFFVFFPLLCCALFAVGQSDVTIGPYYQLNLQRQGINADAFILHNAKVDANANFSWQTTHSSFGSRGMAMGYLNGITFYADALATTAGQTFSPTPRMFIGNNGIIGIGTTSPGPQTKLHVYESGSSTSTWRGRIVSSGDASAVVLGEYNGKATIGGHNPALNSWSDLFLQFYGGNVGIGTLTANQKLEVNGSFLQNSENTALGIDAQANARLGFIKKSGYWPMIASDVTAPIIFAQSNQTGIHTNISGSTLTERMRIDVTGNIGIGTTTPQSTLDVNGNIQISNASIPMGLMTEVGGTTPLLNMSVNFREPNKNAAYLGAAFRIDTRSDGQLFQWLSRPANGGEGILMSLSQSGSLGIGTTNPGSYKLAVEGKIGAREVNVTAANPWPDYVFEKNYKLTSLEEIKNYIDQNQHLPEVPSSKEVEKNGVNIGEMNVLLLKKIEELTLHLIEQNKKTEEVYKKMEEMQLENLEMKKEIQDLKTKK